MSEHVRQPEIVQWINARQSILDAVAVIAAAKRGASGGANDRVVIGITGPVGAGKSTLAAQLSSCVIATDHYFPNYDVTPEHLRDLPEHSDLPRLASDLAALRRGEDVTIPVWSFVSHSREGYQRV